MRVACHAAGRVKVWLAPHASVPEKRSQPRGASELCNPRHHVGHGLFHPYILGCHGLQGTRKCELPYSGFSAASRSLQNDKHLSAPPSIHFQDMQWLQCMLAFELATLSWLGCLLQVWSTPMLRQRKRSWTQSQNCQISKFKDQQIIHGQCIRRQQLSSGVVGSSPNNAVVAACQMFRVYQQVGVMY